MDRQKADWLRTGQSVQLESLTNENLAIQEEVHNLKIDSRFVEQEARKIGLSRPNEKILVPVN